MKFSLLFIADRGHMRVFAADRSTREPGLRLLMKMDFPEGQRRQKELVTDKAGAFPSSGYGGHMSGASERTTLDMEMETRVCRHVAEEIEEVLHEHNTALWAFAAPAEINAEILDDVDTFLRTRLVMNLRSDLTKEPPARLAQRFAFGI